MKITTEGLQKRFWECKAEKEVIQKRIAPMIKKRDELVAEATPINVKIKQMGKEIKASEGPELAELDQEMATITRALGNKVGIKPKNL